MIGENSLNNKTFFKIPLSEIQLGTRFSAPVFFDDGKNMFLAESKTVKKYHIEALKRWKIPFLLSFGHKISENENTISENQNFIDDEEIVEELESVDD